MATHFKTSLTGQRCNSMPLASINGFRMFYDVRGSGDAVVFIHGGFPCLYMHFRANNDVWGWEEDVLDDFRFVMFHRRGCWLSSRPKNGYDISNQVRDLIELLDHLGIDQAHIIGSSAGGPIAVVFASTHYDRVKTLVLAGTGVDLFPAEDPVTTIAREQVKSLEERGPEAAWSNRPDGVELTIAVLWEREEMKERGVLDEYEERMLGLSGKASLMSRSERIEWYTTELLALDAYIDADVTDHCARLKVPTLVVHGERDREVPVQWGRGLASKISGARLRTYSDVSHSPVHQSSSVRQDIMEFMKANR